MSEVRNVYTGKPERCYMCKSYKLKETMIKETENSMYRNIKCLNCDEEWGEEIEIMDVEGKKYE